MLLGQKLPRIKEVAEDAGPHVWMAWFSTAAQVAIPCLLLFLVFEQGTGTNPLFSTIFEASWSGGHGTAAGMEQAWSALGWEEGTSLALGAATISLIFGILMGTILINIGARRGHLKYLGEKSDAGGSDVLGEEESEGHMVTRLSPQSLSTLGFHFALILVAILIGFGLKTVLDPIITGMPLFPLAMIGGFVVHLAISRTSLYRLVDKSTLDAIAAVFLDFLVVSAVASLSIPVILENWIALTVISLTMAVLSLGIFFFLAPRIFKRDWFENGLVQFGTQTGVVATALLLLRTADPKMRSNGYRGLALSRPFISPFIGGGLVTALFPILVMEYGNLWVGLGCLLFCIVLMPLARAIGLWAPSSSAKRQDAERVEAARDY
ncbi:sodium/glutamate symporter [Brevibacterium sp. FAM 25378]